MLLCHCRGVNDRVISTAIACGARSVEDIAKACGAGGRCGGCVPAIEDLLVESRVDVLVSTAKSA